MEKTLISTLMLSLLLTVTGCNGYNIVSTPNNTTTTNLSGQNDQGANPPGQNDQDGTTSGQTNTGVRLPVQAGSIANPPIQDNVDNTKVEVRISNNRLSFINPEKVNESTIKALLKKTDVINNISQIDLSKTKITISTLKEISNATSPNRQINEGYKPLSKLETVLIIDTPKITYLGLSMLGRRGSIEEEITFIIKHSISQLSKDKFEYLSKEDYERDYEYKASENSDEIKIIDLNEHNVDIATETKAPHTEAVSLPSNLLADIRGGVGKAKLKPASHRIVKSEVGLSTTAVEQQSDSIIDAPRPQSGLIAAIDQKSNILKHNVALQVNDAGILHLDKDNQYVRDNHLTDLFKDINKPNSYNNTKDLKILNLARTNVTEITLNNLYANIDLLSDFTTLNVFNVPTISKEQLVNFTNKFRDKVLKQPIKICHSLDELKDHQGLKNIEFIYHDEKAQEDFDKNLNSEAEALKDQAEAEWE